MKKSIFVAFFVTIGSVTIINSAEEKNIPKFSIPIDYKLFFDEAVLREDIDTIIALLTSENEPHIDFKENYPFAMKLYRILMEYSPGEDFSDEARYIPFKTLIKVAKELAIAGSNDRFIKNIPK